MSLNSPKLDDLAILTPPCLAPERTELLRNGVVIYDLELPSIICSAAACPARAWGSGSRHFGDIEESSRERAVKYRNASIDSIPVRDFEELFGYRHPLPDNPSGYSILPGAVLGDANLFFAKQPEWDMLWPKWGEDTLFVSEKAMQLLQANQIGGIVYHDVASARIIGEEPFEKLMKGWRWSQERFRNNVPVTAGRSAPMKFYELEIKDPPASCGLRFAPACPFCGYLVHDVTEARTNGHVDEWNGNDVFWIRGLGLPVWSSRVIDLLERNEIRQFSLARVTETIQEIIENREI